MFEIFTILADFLTVNVFGLNMLSRSGAAVHFFIEDTSKIFALLVLMIYAIAFIRASLNLDAVRLFLQKRGKWFGYISASIFGAITPFCSCSSIPLFLGFTAAKIPTGVTLSFLITSPLINEVAVVMLGSFLGWKFTLVYVFSGIVVGVLGGFLFDLLGASKWLQPLAMQMQKSAQAPENLHSTELSLHDRHRFAQSESTDIFKKIWLWVILGVGIGAGLHGFVPENWISSHLGQNSFWSVPVAVLLGIPLYSNATAMIPIIEILMQKGLPVGTALAFMLATVGASLPEFIMLKQVLKPRLLVYLFLYFLVAFTLVGWLINALF